jgi:hypothetical protein
MLAWEHDVALEGAPWLSKAARAHDRWDKFTGAVVPGQASGAEEVVDKVMSNPGRWLELVRIGRMGASPCLGHGRLDQGHGKKRQRPWQQHRAQTQLSRVPQTLRQPPPVAAPSHSQSPVPQGRANGGARAPMPRLRG